MPVMEGKCVLFKAFGDVDAFPLCVTHARTWTSSWTRCTTAFRLASAASTWRTSPRPAALRSSASSRSSCDIPIFHDDQHGTAVITLAGLTNALQGGGQEAGGREDRDLRRGRGGHRHHEAAARARASRTSRMCDRKGAIYAGPPRDMNWIKTEMAEVTNLEPQGGHAGRCARWARMCSSACRAPGYRHDRDGHAP